MPSWAKVVFVVVLIALALMIAGVIFAGRWVRGRFNAFENEGVAAGEEGRQFGTGRGAEACVAESLERAKECSSVLCDPKIIGFMYECLNAATTPPHYCDTIAAGTSSDELRRWRFEECDRRGWGHDRRCVLLMSVLQGHCARKKRDDLTQSGSAQGTSPTTSAGN